MDSEYVLRIYKSWDQIFTKEKDHLTELDSVGGDGDLGIVMFDGFKEMNRFVQELNEKNVGKIFYQSGKRLNQVASSSMGTLLSSAFMKVGKAMNGKTTLDNNDIVSIVQSIADGVKTLGGAQEGEKTFLDSIYPAARAMAEHVQEETRVMLNYGVEAAKEGVNNAKNMFAKQGRLAFRGEASVGIVDPGSVVALYLVEGMLNALD